MGITEKAKEEFRTFVEGRIDWEALFDVLKNVHPQEINKYAKEMIDDLEDIDDDAIVSRAPAETAAKTIYAVLEILDKTKKDPQGAFDVAKEIAWLVSNYNQPAFRLYAERAVNLMLETEPHVANKKRFSSILILLRCL